MSYNISQVQYHTVRDGDIYLLDANIWLNILTPHNTKNTKESTYIKLFEVIKSNTKARIVLPSLIVSEVVNRILREVYMNKFIKKEKIDKLSINSGFYKETYRKTEHFRISYNMLVDDIKSYNSTVDLINDGFGDELKYKHVLSNLPTGLDFNDNYYYLLAKKREYIVVTDDKDFWVQDIKIITQSQTLIDKSKEELGRIARESLSSGK